MGRRRAAHGVPGRSSPSQSSLPGRAGLDAAQLEAEPPLRRSNRCVKAAERLNASRSSARSVHVRISASGWKPDRFVSRFGVLDRNRPEPAVPWAMVRKGGIYSPSSATCSLVLSSPDSLANLHGSLRLRAASYWLVPGSSWTNGGQQYARRVGTDDRTFSMSGRFPLHWSTPA